MHGEIVGWDYATGEPLEITWREGRIADLQGTGDTPPNLWIAPPLVDLQINGFGGVDFQQDDVTGEQLVAATRGLQRAGCGRYFVTLMTDEWPRMMRRLQALRALRAQSPLLQKAIAGWHTEGPFLSEEPGFCGAHNPAWMRDPQLEQIQELRRLTGDDPVLLTLAPERANAMPAIREATSLGIKVSLGHTNAGAEILVQAIEAGASGFTHLGNGCPRLLNRHDNIVWRVFDAQDRRLTVSLIPDKIHVSPAFFRLAHQVLGSGSIYYTTDAMAAAGAPPGSYRLGPLRLEVGRDEVVRLPGQPNFAGSALKPVDGVFRAAEMLGCGWQETWRRFSEAPARFVGLEAGLKVGGPASFCVVEIGPGKEFVSMRVLVDGEWI